MVVEHSAGVWRCALRRVGMSASDAIIQLLSSDKATHRRHGKDKLEQLIKNDVKYCHVPNKDWWGVISSVMEWESKELQHVLKKAHSANLLYMNVSLIHYSVIRSASVIIMTIIKCNRQFLLNKF